MGRPATGQTKGVSFRPPAPLLERFDEVRGERERTDALIEAMHLWIEHHERPDRQDAGADDGPVP